MTHKNPKSAFDIAQVRTRDKVPLSHLEVKVTMDAVLNGPRLSRINVYSSIDQCHTNRPDRTVDLWLITINF